MRGPMSSHVYALLVGIDQYLPPVRPLSGCVADVDALETLLRGRIPASECHVVVLNNEQATYASVTKAFLEHLGKAGRDDVALFYYSGHGSQAPTAPEFWHLEPDRLDETLVCHDSRMPGRHDLADKELSKLIAEVAKNGPHIAIFLDSCHSGSATRDVESASVRRVPTDDRPRSAETYLVTPSELARLDSMRSVGEVRSGWMQLPRGRHIVLSACQSDEEAKEIRFDGQMRGVFSYFLIDALRQTSATWTYRDLFARVNALVRAKVARQSPLIEATDFQDLDRPFLGGAVRQHPPYFTVRHEKEHGWTLDGGVIHGLQQPLGNETTHLVVFAIQTADLENATLAVGVARVKRADATRALVDLTFDGDKEPDPDTTYKAVVTALPLPPLAVRMEGDESGVAAVRAALGNAGPTESASLLVHEVNAGADLTLIAHDSTYRIVRSGDERPLCAVVDDGDLSDRPRRAVEYLEHLARWIRLANLSNPSSRLAADSVRVDFFLVKGGRKMAPIDAASSGSGIRLNYEYRDGEWHQPRIRIRLTNTGKRRLYCMLLDLTDRFKVSAALLPGGGVWLDPSPKNEVWAFNGDDIPVSLPDELWLQGMTEYKDLLKLLVATDECDATRFEQSNIEIRYGASAMRGASTRNTLERLMQRVFTRDLGETGTKDRLMDWATSEVSITVVRPLDATALSGAGGEVTVAPTVTLVGHQHFRATARLTTLPHASRDAIGARPLPAWLRDDPATVQPFQLCASRDVESGISVLELTEVSDYAAVTPDQPLLIRVDAVIGSQEHVLPIVYDPDSDCFVPVGVASSSAAGVQINIKQLPKPTSDTRSLSGSIKILFQKVICERLGFGYPYPLLASLEASGARVGDPERVQSLVSGAHRILLYVHGIIGDTREMSVSAYRPEPFCNPPLESIGERYDLVLTFDYENINTSIMQTARDLKRRFEEVGLGAGHSKTVHIVAHSMGGLVSRWFIEREGGSEMVQHLTMLGTPNAGSPWPRIQDWATTAIGLGLNALTTVMWPAKVLGGLVAAIESVDVALDEMKAGSVVLAGLADSPDPGIPYALVAGNTSINPAALLAAGGQASRFERLLASLRSRPVLQKAASLAFFGHPNDVAVSVESIRSIPIGRITPVVVQEVACDHMSYFTTVAGLQALARALPPKSECIKDAQKV